MATQIGSAAHLQWITSSATLTLNTDYRSFNTNETMGLIEETAGADTAKKFINSYPDGDASFQGLYQVGGTAIFTSCAGGQLGTLKYAPDGSVAGSICITIPAISKGVKMNSAYNNTVEVSVDWQQNGARSYGTL
jgi:hypothetical protein